MQLSSMGGRLSFAGVSAYTASKFALEGLSEELPLGNDAADAISDALDRARAEFQAWESLTRSTDL